MFAVVGDAALAARYQLPLISETDTHDYSAWLIRTDGILCLAQNYLPDLKPLSLDFNQGKTAYRLRQSLHIKEPIGRACGISKGRRPEITDATAGLAQDGLLLAALGAKVTLIEQHPLIHALIDDALMRGQSGPAWLTKILSRVTLLHADSRLWLSQHTPEVIYLDPMYPEPDHVRTAAVKKPMQILRGLPGTATDTRELLSVSRAACLDRLVVKRPNWAESLSPDKPTSRLDTKTHHYDIYLME